MLEDPLDEAISQNTPPKQVIYRYKDWEIYKNDLRFVNICLNYALQQPSPPQFFEFMKRYRIGQYSMKFYTEWITYFHKNKNYQLVDKLHKLATTNNAQPASLLALAPKAQAPPVPKRTFNVYIDGNSGVITKPKTKQEFLDIVDQSLKAQKELDIETINKLSFNERVMVFREFGATRKFETRSFAKIQAPKTTALISHDERLYMDHRGHTEVYTTKTANEVSSFR